MSRSLVALVGRPNVGKSTLFNRLVGQRISVVDDRPGTTRDRIQAPVEWNGTEFTLIDTGGIEPLEAIRDKTRVLAEDSQEFVREIREQAEMAIADADVIIFTVDLQTGLTSVDEAVADILRKLVGKRQRAGKTAPPILVAASKGDTQTMRNNAAEFYALGFGEVFPTSGLHGDGTGDLLDAVVAAIPKQDIQAPDDTIKISLIGRPNVGKSSMFNQLIGEPRVIVSDVAGTTRDAIDTVIDFVEQQPDKPTWDDDTAEAPDLATAQRITLIDTAGIRKRGSIEPGVEKFSVLRAFKAIERSDIALLMIDAYQGITAQDEHIAGYVLEANKSAIIVVNKWDLIESAEKVERLAKPVKGLGLLTEKMEMFMQEAQQKFNFMSYVPIIFVSAATGFRCDQLLPAAMRVFEARHMRISTSEVNTIVREAMEKHAPPTHAGKRLKVLYGSQVAINPPTFLFHVNDAKLVHFAYERYLENQIRERYGFLGTPIRISFRGKADRE